MSDLSNYRAFLSRKAISDPMTGLETVPPLCDALFPFQSDIVTWATAFVKPEGNRPLLNVNIPATFEPRNSGLVNIDLVSTVNRVRQADRRQVDALTASIGEVGLLNPITVAPTEFGYGLIAGMHRLEACKALGWQEIPAIVIDLDANRLIIAECDENLCAPSLTAVERAMFTRRRKEAYEALHPETINGMNQHLRVRQVGEGSPATRFTIDTAQQTGKSERAIQRDAERGERVAPKALEMVQGTKLDTGKYLDALKPLAPEAQVAKIEADLSPAPAPVIEFPRAEPEDKERREIKKLSLDGMVDEIIGLRADLKDWKARAGKYKDERDKALSSLKEFTTASDMGRALGQAQRRATEFQGRMNEYMSTAKRLEYRLKKAEARVAELEITPVPMGGF